MYRIYIMYDTPGWAYWRRAVALQKYAPSDFEVAIGTRADLELNNEKSLVIRNNDLIYNCDYASSTQLQSALRRFNRRYSTTCLHVVSYNSDQYRNPRRWGPIVEAVDFVIANNRLIFNHFRRPRGTCNISNGIDTDHFFPANKVESRPAHVLWCGSSSPCKTKGYAEVIIPLERLSDNRDVKWKARFRPIDEVDERVWDTATQNEWYNNAQVVLCVATGEGTPNYLIEGAMAGCVPVTTTCGNAPEWLVDGVNGIAIEKNDVASATAGIERAIADAGKLSRGAIKTMMKWSYEVRAKYFFALFRKLIDEGPAAVNPFTWSEIRPDEI